MIGETIKDLKITRRLGAGAFGEVWAAEQQMVRPQVAIKLLHAASSMDKKQVDRFFAEATTAGKIQHAGS